MARDVNYDLPPGEDPPAPGDLIRSTRNRYRVLDVRPVESRVWSNRWKLTLENLGRHEDAPWAEGEHSFRRYRPGEGPEDSYGPWPEDG